jgi:hypothetical protein
MLVTGSVDGFIEVGRERGAKEGGGPSRRLGQVGELRTIGLEAEAI